MNMTKAAILRPMEADQAIAQALRDEMKRRGLTQTQLAELAGIPQPSVARVLTGKRGKISTDLIKMLNALGLKLVVVKDD
jgi:predicted XRE-type DNA-binding protein